MPQALSRQTPSLSRGLSNGSRIGRSLADLAQTGRQDARHVVILWHVLPVYLADLQRAAVADRLPERRLIELLERLLKIVSTPKARKVLASLSLDARPPLFSALGHEKLPKLQAFLDRRLSRHR